MAIELSAQELADAIDACEARAGAAALYSDTCVHAGNPKEAKTARNEAARFKALAIKLRATRGKS